MFRNGSLIGLMLLAMNGEINANSENSMGRAIEDFKFIAQYIAKCPMTTNVSGKRVYEMPDRYAINWGQNTTSSGFKYTDWGSKGASIGDEIEYLVVEEGQNFPSVISCKLKSNEIICHKGTPYLSEMEGFPKKYTYIPLSDFRDDVSNTIPCDDPEVKALFH